MTEIFREKSLPQELVFLPLIESGFRLNAYSRQKAAGPWQFIPSTAKRFGLKINWWVDERRDPIKSTRAAAEYLKVLYKRFNSWNLALAAYNAGEMRIQRALKRAKSNDFWVLRKTRYIRRETKNYVPSYIAATAIAMHPERFGFDNVTYHSPLMYDEVTMYSPIDLTLVAEFTDSKTADIKTLNPELRRWCTPPNVSSYTLKIPFGTKEKFIANLSNAREDELLYVEFYKVNKGDTVWSIARKFRVPAQAIIDLNSLNKRALIIAGKKIIVPSPRTDKSEKRTASPRIRPILKRNPKSKTAI
jgi:membrane-bound lytic murein transglycosylase D